MAGILAVAVLWPGQARAQGPAGKWEGSIEVPGSPLDVIVELTKGDTAWTGKISIPAQQASDLPLGVKVDGVQVTFSITGVQGDPTFSGKVSEDGSTLSGDFTQMGNTFPFSLKRAKAEGKQ